MEKFNRGETIRILLGNFQAEILEEITYDDGAEIKKFYVITGTDIRGNKLPTLTVPVEKFNSLSWISDWGNKTIIEPGYSVKENLRCAIQKNSNNIEYRLVYGHIGWRKIDGIWLYLHSEGAIGKDGIIEEIEVDFGNRLNSINTSSFDYYRFEETLSGNSLKNALICSLTILELAPNSVTYPLFAGVFSSVLNEILTTDFSIFVVGKTGCQKSELCAIAQSFFGKGFTASSLPANWSSTANALEKQSFIIKDSILTVDDFTPTGTDYDIKSQNAKAERLLRGAGNRSGRWRLNANTNFQITYFSRSLIISSGEDVPRGHSLLSRIIMLEMFPGCVDLDKLTIAQQNAGRGVFANCMATHLQWLAPKLDYIKKEVKSRHEYYRSYYRKLKIAHDRTPDNFAILSVGFEYFLKFACEVKAISQSDSDKYMQDFFDVCKDLMESQKQHLSTQDPVDTFLSILPEALLSGSAHISNIKNGEAPQSHRIVYGWVEGSSYHTWNSEGKLIGYVDQVNQDIYLLAESTYSVIRGFCSQQGNNFGTSAPTLWKRCRERGLLASTDKNQNAIRKTILSNRIRVLHFKISSLLSIDSPPSPDSPPKSSSASIHDEDDFRIQTFTDFDEEKG